MEEKSVNEKINAPKLMETPEGLALVKDNLVMVGDFTKMLPRLKHNNLSHEMVVKAAKIKNADYRITVVDATAGMGEDSLLLAAAGFNVILYEYDPIIGALLEDTIKRSKEIPELSEIVSRMELKLENSIEGMKKLDFSPDVILLDPMFPERQKSGMIKKKFQLIQQLEKPCDDEEALFDSATLANPKRIIVKRPQKGPFLADKKPSYSLDGKAIRYDVYILNTDNKNQA